MLDQISHFMNTMLFVVGALVIIGTAIGAVKYGFTFVKQMAVVMLVIGFMLFLVRNL
ncbi:hypothetical protein [Priestia megaterium]|uniref:hypothetical protein n=1 Tax=Priestia megaterium TaxID=1404 RepID=UPI002E1FE044|nr:hypothetical protein [Priestia megaterium]MED4102157.1 hypothetical protein [Priestia megaterium]MED4142584.1 hypothetical protein [Priestia megaterium]